MSESETSLALTPSETATIRCRTVVATAAYGGGCRASRGMDRATT